jgi:PhzF family phenazine biosynthesis protein
MQTRRFIQCDVFTPVPTLGNALAVVVDGDELSEQVMQQFAAWTNLAETTFILPPLDAQADYRLKLENLHAGARSVVCGPPDAG